jgi:hypothetical protein
MRDQAIDNALHYKTGASFSDGNIVVGVSPGHVAIAFNNTVGQEHQLVPMTKATALSVMALLSSALGVRVDWEAAPLGTPQNQLWTVEKNNAAWTPGEYRVLGALGNGASVIQAQGSFDECTVIANALNFAGAIPRM